MGKYLLFVMTLLTTAVYADENGLFSVHGKDFAVRDDGVVVCTAGCSNDDSPVELHGDRADYTFTIWYMAGPTVFGRNDGGVACPSGSWLAIDTYGLRVVELKLPSCDAVIDTKIIASGGKIEYQIVQENKTSRFVFTE